MRLPLMADRRTAGGGGAMSLLEMQSQWPLQRREYERGLLRLYLDR